MQILKIFNFLFLYIFLSDVSKFWVTKKMVSASLKESQETLFTVILATGAVLFIHIALKCLAAAAEFMNLGKWSMFFGRDPFIK